MFRGFKSHTFLQSLYQRYHSHDTYGTPLYHRIDYLRVFYSAGIHRVDFGDTKETRIIFPPVDFGLKSKVMDAHIV